MDVTGAVMVTAENLTLKKPLEENGVILEPGLYVRLSFKDQGMGIAEENLVRIFVPYFTTKQKGSGLGLTCCYFIIKKHDGYIHVTSMPGRGTAFTIYLPASPYAVIDSTSIQDDWSRGSGRVLVMDDEEGIRRVTLSLLKRLGYEGVGAQDGKETIEKYTRATKDGVPFDIVIMDLAVPGGMGGLETMQHLHQFDPHVSSIVASGYSNDPVMAEYTSYGFKGVIKKPFNLSDLALALAEIVKASAEPTRQDQVWQQAHP
jgi:CheY-like chemotaxis protein